MFEQLWLRGVDILSGKTNLLKWSFASPLKRVCSKRKEFGPLGSKFFPFRTDPFPEGIWCAEKQSGSHQKVVSLNKKWRNIDQVYKVPVNFKCLTLFMHNSRVFTGVCVTTIWWLSIMDHHCTIRAWNQNKENGARTAAELDGLWPLVLYSIQGESIHSKGMHIIFRLNNYIWNIWQNCFESLRALPNRTP